MKWANVVNEVITQIVEQATRPDIDGDWISVDGMQVGPGYVKNGSSWEPPQLVSQRMTKRAFWSRFPAPNFVAMQAILRSGSPALLAGRLGAMQVLVSDSPFVDTKLQQVIDNISGASGLASSVFPETVTIDGTTLPLRLTAEQAAAILAEPAGEEIFNG